MTILIKVAQFQIENNRLLKEKSWIDKKKVRKKT